MRSVLSRVCLALVLLAAVASGSALAAAEDSTPAPTGGPMMNTANPQVGDTVSYISESGSEVARLRVAEVVLDWTEYSEYYVPSPGSQYIAVVVEVTSFSSRGSLIVRADDFRLQDIDGFFYTRSWADAAENATLIPAESEVGVGAGATEELVLVYEVLTGVELAHLFWQPDYERLLTIANLDGYVPGQE
jgi:hypothetical protein